MCCGSPAKGAGFGGKTKNVLIGSREILRGWREVGREREKGERGGKRGEKKTRGMVER